MPLPPIAREIGCESWPQLALTYVVSHPAVTAAIPATGNPDHLADNMRAGSIEIDEPARKRIAAAWNHL